MRPDGLKKGRDAADAEELLKQETLSEPLKLSSEQISVVKTGLPDVIFNSQQAEEWWTRNLGL